MGFGKPQTPIPYNELVRRLDLYRAMVSAGLLMAAAGPGMSQETQPTTPTPPQVHAPAPAPSPAEAPEAAPKPSVEDIIGLSAARRRLGRDIPIGRGIVAGHVEGNGQAYLPNWHDPTFTGTLLVQRSGQGTVFGHAQGTASVIYGRGGLAPGIQVVHCFSTGQWIGEGYLKTNSAEPPADDLPRLFNHSWIGEPSQGAELVLRRVDYQIDQRDVLMCVGVNNGRGSAVPALLASAYNVISVGSAGGNSSGGYTHVEGDGRCKPGIIAPRKTTSMATPTVTACVARLMEAADTLDGSDSDRRRAAHSELVKAVLLAGADKPDGWDPAPGKPLDEHLGAGVVQIDNSLRIMQAGPSDPGRIQRRYGWDFRALEPDDKAIYRFTTTEPLGEVSIMLVWNRRITGVTLHHPQTGKALWVGKPRLADFDLRLIRIRGAGDDGGGRAGGGGAQSLETLATSASSIDNVEHIYLTGLEPGEYVIEVQRQADGHDEPWDYALAWRVETP